jgi:hypothetical protein
VRSPQWKGTLPGRAAGLLGFEAYDPANVVDNSHPALQHIARQGARRRGSLPSLPHFNDAAGALTARAFPNAFLTAHAVPLEMDPMRAYVLAERAAKNASRTAHVAGRTQALASASTMGERFALSELPLVATSEQDALESDSAMRGPRRRGSMQWRSPTERTPMPWVTVVGAQTVHKSSRVRTRISARLKTAASLIAIRGADAQVRPPKTRRDPTLGANQQSNMREDEVDVAETKTPKASVSKDDARTIKARSSPACPPIQTNLELVFKEDDAGAEKWVASGSVLFCSAHTSC